MRISTRGRYALRAMVDLALHTDGGAVSRCDIATRQGISADYVAQLFRRLRVAGLVEGVRGPGGGYRLARDATTIYAKDVVWAVEGPIDVTGCVAVGGDLACQRVEECVTRVVWQLVARAVEEVLSEITLAELRDKARTLVMQDVEVE
ncbi:MAG: Rrf2 family transcriptional regulator [Chloroflexota bacterium]|nr:Rrf2 family transcriptional regulator [Chloroflexota bacterium]